MKIAAIDIGSNAIRLLISRALPSENGLQFKKVEFIRIPLRLGDDVFTKGKIGEEKKKLFIMTMNAFKLIIDIHKVKVYMACATSAMREAENGQAIVKRVEKKLGLKIHIISGEKESQLILKSVLNYFPQSGNYINIDVGGGSTEMTIIRNHVPIISKSFPVGTVRLMDGMVDPKIWKDMEKWVLKNTKGIQDLAALGTGGNINKLHRMLSKNANAAVPFSALKELHNKISNLPIQERIYKLKLNPDRADVIEHAGKIYLSIMEWANIKEIYSPAAGLKEGIILELWEKYQNPE